MKYRFCINCGHKISGNSQFCPYCGAKQTNVSNNNTVNNPQSNIYSSGNNRGSYYNQNSFNNQYQGNPNGNLNLGGLQNNGYNNGQGNQTFNNTNMNYTNMPPHRDFVQAIQLFFQNWNNFRARSTRAEVWWVLLFIFIVQNVLSLISPILSIIFQLIMLYPIASLGIRRLYDCNEITVQSKLLLEIVLFIPGIDSIVLFIIGFFHTSPYNVGCDYTNLNSY